MYREVWCTGRRGVQGGVVYWEAWCIGRCGVQGGVVYREAWCTGRCGVQGGVVYREAWCTGRCGVQGGVVYREVWVMGRCGVIRMVGVGSHIRRRSVPGRHGILLHTHPGFHTEGGDALNFPFLGKN